MRVRARGAGGGDGQDRVFVDHARARAPRGTSTPRSGPCAATRSPTGSPPSIRRFSTAMSAPISRSVVNRPRAQRVQPDAGDGQPRARHQQRRDQQEGGGGGIARAPRVGAATAPAGLAASMIRPRARRPRPARVAPKWRSMFSVWSRVASGSSTRVMPGAFRPAQQARPTSPGPRRPARGSPAAAPRAAPCDRQRQAAALARARNGRRVADSGSITRRIGRSRRLASPVITAKSGWLGQDAAQQPGGGAGIAHVEHVGRLEQPADAAAGDAPGAVGDRGSPRRRAPAWRRRCAARPRPPAGR